MANGIKNDSNASIHNYLGERNNNSIFLEPVIERGILNIVNECANKTSIDYKGLNMSMVKNIINNIVKPFYFS